MYVESRYSTGKLNRFPGRFSRKAVAALLVLLVFLGGVIWKGTGAGAVTIDIINSTFESGDGGNWTAYGINNATVNVSSSVNNHTTGGSTSAMIETQTVGAAVYTSAGIKRAFTTPKGPLSDISLSLYYQNTSGSSLNLEWEIMNAEETVKVAGGTISSSASEHSWTQYQISNISGLLPDYNYVLRLYADGKTLNQDGAAMSVNWDDIVLTADYTASPAAVSISTSRTSIPNNTITAATVTATVYDQNGQVMSGQAVNFTKDQIWGTFSPASVDTDINGKAITDFTSDTGGVIRLTATSGSASNYVDINVLYPASITVSSSMAKIPNNNSTIAKITARVLDQNGQVLPGVKVEFNKVLVSGSLSASFDMTDARGEAQTLFKSDVGAEYDITARSYESPDTSISKTTTVVVQEPKTLAVSVNKSSIPNDNSSLVIVTAHLTDQSGNDMNGEVITFTRTPETGTLSSASATTRSNGTAQVTFKSSEGSSYTITGTVYRTPTVNSSSAVKVVAPTTLTLSSSDTVIPSDNKTVSTITATLKDQDNIPISGEKISLTTDLGVFTSSETNTVNNLVTDTNGQVTADFKSDTGGTATIVGTVVRTGLTNINPYTLTVESPVPKTIIINSSLSSVPDDNLTEATITATVYDQLGNVMSGRTVNFTKSTNSGSFTPIDGSVTTDSNGRASVKFKSDQAGTVTITANCSELGSTATGNTNVSVIARVPQNLTLTASSASIPDDGSTPAIITAQLLDQFGRPFSNRTITFSKDKPWGTIDSTKVVTDSFGEAVVNFKSSISGEIKITANSGEESAQQVITVIKRTGASLTLTATSPEIISETLQESIITAQLKDQFGQPLAGEQVNFSAAVGKLTAATAITDASGNASVTLKSSATGTSVVTGTVDEVLPVMGVVMVEFRSTDYTSPYLESVEPTSKQVFYLKFSENIEFDPDPPTGWTLKKYVGEAVYDVPYETPVILSGDRRVVRITLQGDNMDTGNQYPNPVRYEISISGVTDIAGNIINPPNTVRSFDAFSPHGKYASYPVPAGNSARICAQCHSSHKAVGNKLLTGSSIKKVCFVCHGSTGMSSYKVESEFYRSETGGYSTSMHKALDSDSPGYDDMTCVDCHNPHGVRRSGSNDILPKLLKAKDAEGNTYTSADGNRFCLACHGSSNVNPQYDYRFGSYWNDTLGDHSGGMTIVDDVYNSAHYDIRSSALNPLSQTNITCNKCHERHGSAASGLIDNSVAGFTSERLCYKCHDTNLNSLNNVDIKQKFEAAGGTTSKHNITEPETIGLSCQSCHEPHSTAARSFADSGADLPSDISDPSNTRKNWNKSSGSISEFCIKCHDTDSNVTVTQTRSISELVPFTVKLPDVDFANGTGWNKTTYTNSIHYTRGIDCDRCHDPHGSDYKRLTLYQEDSTGEPAATSGVCLRCHGGGAAPSGKDIYTNQLDAEFRHTTLSVTGKHSDTEDYSNMTVENRHAECYDCHDPHTVKASGSSQTDNLGRVSGVRFSQEPWSSWSSSSATLAIMETNNSSRQAYLCYKCHSKFSYNTTPPVTPSSTGSWQGVFNQTDVAKEFNPANPARHVVEGNSQMPSFTVDQNTYDYGKFIPGWKADSSMKCTDCHGPSAGSANGPHGSGKSFILKDSWDNTTGEASTSDHLCFNCHDYNFYTGSDVGSFDVRSQFSTEGDYNLHGGSHQGKACVSCHGAVPHGWSKSDSDGGGLSLFTTADPQPYRDGVLIDETAETENTPGNWAKTTCTTTCHTE